MAYIRVPLVLVLLVPIMSADPDPLQDFCVADISSSSRVFNMNGHPCIDPAKATAEHFTTSVLGKQGNTSANYPFGVNLIATTMDVLPGINALGIIMARVDFAVGGVLPPHLHPRASEIIFLLKGKLKVGFVDTTNKLFSVVMRKGDVFVFPKALLHFAQNVGKRPATVIAALNSEAPGNAVIPFATFASNPAIPNTVLAKSFQISVMEVDTIRNNLGRS